MKREIRKRVRSILMTSIYFVVMTILSFQLNANYALAGNFNILEIHDISDGLQYINAFPTQDENGLKQDSYVFEIANTSNRSIRYVVGFESDKEVVNTLDFKYIRYSISKDNQNFSEVMHMDSNGYLTTDVLKENTKQVYYLKFWIDYNAGNEILNKSLNFRVNVTEFDTVR